ncbi:MAG TPA: type II CAAX endopeptidase family protein [Candidatus Nanopelagicales bacterium]|nr:type II CAAX endopeptidase family protein [Candidatus Nanopelagicales bacterium]
MADREQSRIPAVVWSVWVVAALVMLPILAEWQYTLVVAASAVLLAAYPPLRRSHSHRAHDGRELMVMALLYVAVVALMRWAFVGFGTDQVAGLFLCFAAALLIGVLGPVFYETWVGHRPLRAVGLRWDNWRPTVALGLLFAVVQFALTLWGYDLPAVEDWVPLLVMALVVGMFESVFFRGFIQNRVSDRFGPVIGVAVAALAYGLYHVGYGMGLSEIVFLTGLGIVYSVAFALVRNILVLWPLLTPMGSFFANVRTGDIDLPWASIMGFADVAILMGCGIWIAWRHHRKDAGHTVPPRRLTTA